VSHLVSPHGSPVLKPLLLHGQEREEEIQRARTLPQVTITSRETSDLIMLGIGAFTPLEGFMNRADWQGVCDEIPLANRIFRPIPITLSAPVEVAA